MAYMEGNHFPPASPWTALTQQIHHLNGRLEEQQQCMLRMCKQLDDLQKRVQAAESRPLYHIDKLEYQFDQLKVEKLEGTLNIGMTPPGADQMKEIGQLVVPESPFPTPFPQNGAPGGEMPEQTSSGPNVFPAQSAGAPPAGFSPAPPFPELRQEIDRHLDMNAPQRLAQLENEHGVALDGHHRRLVIEDIRKQMGERIHYYIQTGLKKNGNAEAADPAADLQLKSDVLSKTIRDIEAAMRSYLLGLQTGVRQQKEGDR